MRQVQATALINNINYLKKKWSRFYAKSVISRFCSIGGFPCWWTINTDRSVNGRQQGEQHFKAQPFSSIWNMKTRIQTKILYGRAVIENNVINSSNDASLRVFTSNLEIAPQLVIPKITMFTYVWPNDSCMLLLPYPGHLQHFWLPSCEFFGPKMKNPKTGNRNSPGKRGTSSVNVLFHPNVQSARKMAYE